MTRRLRRVASVGIVLLLGAGLTAGGNQVGAVGSAVVAHVTRQSRVSNVAIAGGDVYVWSAHRSSHAGGGCTVSFAVRSRSTGRAGALIAGHCVGTLAGGPPYVVHQTRNGAHNTTDPGHRLGVVHAHRYHLGAGGDNAVVALTSGRRASASIFTGGATSGSRIPVAGIARLRDGLHVCYSGAVSGEHCGYTVVGKPEQVGFTEGHRRYQIRHEWRANRRTCTSRPGDSGSPVYVKRHGRAYAVGILSGGQVDSGQCPFFFTSITLALHQLGLRLLTTK